MPANAVSSALTSGLTSVPAFINMFDMLPLLVHICFCTPVETALTKSGLSGFVFNRSIRIHDRSGQDTQFVY